MGNVKVTRVLAVKWKLEYVLNDKPGGHNKHGCDETNDKGFE